MATISNSRNAFEQAFVQPRFVSKIDDFTAWVEKRLTEREFRREMRVSGWAKIGEWLRAKFEWKP